MFKKVICFVLSLSMLLMTAIPAFALSAPGAGHGSGSYGSGSSGGNSGGGGGGGGSYSGGGGSSSGGGGSSSGGGGSSSGGGGSSSGGGGSSSGGSAVALPATDGGESEEGEKEEDDEEEDKGGGVVVIINCDCPKLDPYETYKPKVTSIHNLNALLASAKLEEDSSDEGQQNVYYIPTLDELPFDLTAFVKGLGKRNGNDSAVGKFALVYDGFYDSEARLVIPNKEQLETPKGAGYKIDAHTSKSVMTQYNDKALQKIGYDLLLSREKIKITDGGGDWKFQYVAKQCGKKTLTAQVAIMDLYKAMGVFEYDVNFAIGIDPDFDANTSPILADLGVITTPEDHGLDASEGKTYVGVTRTNPALYWDRYLKDGINLGVTALDKNDLSTIYHLNAAVQKDTHVNMLQFCNLAAAVMNLYGESAISPEEESQFDRTCSKYLLDVPEASEIELSSLKYLVIKGIIKATDLGKVDWYGGVHLNTEFEQDVPNNYILGMLGRIADPESRFKLPDIEEINEELDESGYYRTNVTVTNASNVIQASTNSRFAYDYLIEVNKKTAQFVMPVESIEKLEDGSGGNEGQPELDSDYDDEDVVRGDLRATSQAIADAITAGANLRYDKNDKPYTLDLGDIQLGNDSQLSRSSSPDKLDSWVNHKSGEEKEVSKGKYYYYGVEEYDGRYYYHFKLNKKAAEMLNEVKLQFSVHPKYYRPVAVDSKLNSVIGDEVDTANPSVSISSGGDVSLNLGDLDGIEEGGIFHLEETGEENSDPEWVHKSFSDAGFSEEFVDSKTLVASPAESGYQTLLFYIKDKKPSKNSNDNLLSDLQNYDQGKVDWTKLLVSKDTMQFKDRSITLSNPRQAYMSVFAVAAQRSKTNKSPIYRFEVTTDDVDYVKSLELFTKTGASRNNSEQVLDGFFRVNNGDKGGTSLLVSVDYLLENEIIDSFTKVQDGVYLLASNDLENNIIINENRRLVIVGNTVYSVNSEENQNSSDVDGIKQDEVLYTTVRGKQYVNYRACLGWAQNFSVIADAGYDAVMATAPDQYGISVDGPNVDVHTETISVNTYLPQDCTNTMMMAISAYSGDDAIQAQGISLSGTYALAPYLIVHSESETTPDYLFVWHFAECKGYDGKEYTIKQDESKAAIAHFKNLTGIELKKQRGYRLIEYKLKKEDFVTRKGKANTDSPLQYIQLDNNKKSVYFAWKTATLGWIYNPPEFAIRDAIDEYAKGATKKNIKKVKLPLPIFKYKGKTNTFGDANVNMCSESKSSDKFTLGCLPCTFDAKQKNGLVTVKQDGSRAKAKKKLAGKAWKQDTSDYTVWTAPTALFAQIKGLGYEDVSKLDNVTVYYGTSRCDVKDGELSIRGTTSKIDTKAEAVVAYQGGNNNTVYVISENVKFVDELLDKIETKIEYILSDPSTLVDWEAYSFGRLVSNLDNISSVVLLFILSVLPRVATLLFLILILLSTIVEVKPWRAFCSQWFDVYSALTLGHQTVETINTKRMTIISCWALALFIMIQDGALFNFVIWVAKGIVAFYD